MERNWTFSQVIIILSYYTDAVRKEQVTADIATKADILENKFLSLVNEAFECLVKKKVSIDYFYAKVSCMKNVLKKVASMYLEESFDKLVVISSFESLWGKLNRFWDFYNYELFQHVVRVMFAEVDDPVLRQLAEYENDIDEFLASTKLCDFFEVWPFSTDKPLEKDIVELRGVVVRVDRKWEDCTLRDVKKISNTFAQCFFLPREFLFLAGAGKSSVSLLWYVLPSLARTIKEKLKETSDSLSESKFLSIIIDNIPVYPLTPMKQCSLQLQRMYERLNNQKPSAEKLLMPFSFSKIGYDQNKFDRSITTFYYLADGSPVRLLLVEGAPGSGKTTLSLDAVRKWTRKEILTDISTLALFPLRDYNLRNVANIQELLAMITPEYVLLAKELEANKGEGMAFWFDGWDEIASSLDGHSSVYEQIVSGKILPNARVIVTSRSWATDYIKKQFEEQLSQHIQIASSYRIQISWLIELKKQELPLKYVSLLGDFLKFLEQTHAIQGNMHTPLATDITLEVYQWSRETGSPLPTTVTQLYTSYTCLCIRKYLDNHSHFEPKIWKTNNFRDLPEPLRSWFVSLCQLAFDGLVDGQRLVFPDVPNHMRLETLGLMQAQAPLYANEASAVVSYHYKHLTLQEFLSALLLLWMSDEERSKIVERCVSDGRYTMTLRFLSGLTKSSPILRDHIRKDHMRRLLDSIENKDNLTVFHWLFEGGDNASTSDILGGREIRVRSHYSWSALDYFVTGHCIARANCSWDIDFHATHMGDEKMIQFLQALSSANKEQGNAYISSIHLSGNELTSQSICHLHDIPAHFLHRLKSFDLSMNNLDQAAVDHITKIIRRMPRLLILKLDSNPNIQRGGAVSLLSALYDHEALKSLDLHNTKIGEEDCEQLAQLLSSSQCLEELDVSNNSLSSDSVHILFKGLQKNSSLRKIKFRTLTISKNHGHITLEAMKTLSAYLQDKKCKLETLDLTQYNISSHTAVELAHGLSQNCSVKVLYISENPIGDEGAAALGHAMTENKTITELQLASCDITTKGGSALAISLTINSTIEELNISGNSLGGLGAIPSIAQVLQYNKTLKRLYMHNDDSLSRSNVENLINRLRNNKTLEELTLSEKFRVDIDKRVRWL